MMGVGLELMRVYRRGQKCVVTEPEYAVGDDDLTEDSSDSENRQPGTLSFEVSLNRYDLSVVFAADAAR
jgi:hypothetical protein